MPTRLKFKYVFLGFGLCVIAGTGYYVLAGYSSANTYQSGTAGIASHTSPTPIVTHIKTPNPVKAIYMTEWVAGVPSWRTKILKMIDDTELNAIVIDIKDYTGVLISERAPDIGEFIRELHEHDVYVIGRVSVFQDQQYVIEHPELAVRRLDNGGVWRDHKGIAWIDPSMREAWDYIAKIAIAHYELGFDEINLDYIRYPSDGDMNNVSYALATSTLTKVGQMRQFYQYITERLHEEDIIVSADLFGMTTTNTDDLGIGQNIENALRYFDYVCPMVYPSHYPPNFNGWANPNTVPGPVVQFSMEHAVARADIMDGISSTSPASTTPITRFKLRPWLQDFDYGGNYGEAEVRAQIDATYNAGLTSWMVWDAAVKYTPSVYTLDSTTTMR